MSEESEEVRLQGGWAAPEELLIVGLDEVPVEAEDLADPDRIDAPLESLVLDIMRNGVRGPVQIRSIRYGRSSRCKIVINGRQRVMAARIANERLAKLGDHTPIRVPYIIKDGDDKDVAILNEFERRDPIPVRAARAKRFLDRGLTSAEVCQMFVDPVTQKTISLQTLKNWLALLKAPKETRDAVAAGEKSATEAYAEGKGKPARKPREPRTPGTRGPRPPNRARLEELAERFQPTDEEEANEEQALIAATFEYCATGDPELFEEWPWIKRMVMRKPARPEV